MTPAPDAEGGTSTDGVDAVPDLPGSLPAIPTAPAGPVKLKVGATTLDITSQLALGAGKGWREMVITEACAPGLGPSIALTAEAAMTLQIAAVSRVAMPEGADCSF